MFHVKLHSNSVMDLGSASQARGASRGFWPLSAWVGVASAAAATRIWRALAAPPSRAAIHKCTGADGKLRFGDQPCKAGPKATTVKVAAAALTVPNLPNSGNAPGNGSAKDPDASARAAARDRIGAEQTLECVALGGRITPFMQKGALEGVDAEAKPMFDRYEHQCTVQARAANGADNDRNEVRQNQLIVGEECREKRRVLAERRLRLASASSDDKKAFAEVESDVARGYR